MYVEANGNFSENDAIGLTAEMMARVNKKENRKSSPLKLLAGTWYTAEKFNTEVKHAFESSERAMEMFPGTVEGIIISSIFVHSKDNAQTIENFMKKFQKRAQTSGLKLGLRHDRCHELENEHSNVEQILLLSDFMICTSFPSSDEIQNPPVVVAKIVTNRFLQWREAARKVNPKVEIHGETGWSSGGSEWNTVENMGAYWAEMNHWTGENKFRIYMGGAFDNPLNQWSASASHEGWWRLKDNDDTTIQGYEQKFSGMNDIMSSHFYYFL